MLRRIVMTLNMALHLVCFLLFWGMLVTYGATPQAINENEIRQFMTHMEKATQNRAYQEAVSLMAPDIRIHYILNHQKDVVLTKDQYLQNALASGILYSDYQFHIQIHSINIAGSRGAVSYTAYERATSVDHSTIDCIINDVAVIEKRQNHLQMAQLNGIGSMSKQKLF